MSKFVTGKELEDAIYNIIWDAKDILLLVSPFIKLDAYFKKLFDKNQNNPKLHLLLVFGKNEKDVKRSMNNNDFDYFKNFPKVSIIYVPKLHAKYYGNEKQGVITSINLYDYSFKNNIEFGVFSKQTLLDRFSPNADNDAWNTCMDMAESNEVVFIKRPVYENKKMILNIGRNYVKSDILFDSTDEFYGNSNSRKPNGKRLLDFPEELELNSNSNQRPEREEIEKVADQRKAPERKAPETRTYGFCIRTGEKIPFNPKQPMTKEAWQRWNEYKNMDFGEKYCHKTGKPSYGKTSMRKPIL